MVPMRSHRIIDLAMIIILATLTNLKASFYVKVHDLGNQQICLKHTPMQTCGGVQQ